MSTTINTNVSSMNAQRWLAGTQTSLQTSMARLSSGLRVNSAKDDAAGLAIASKLESTARGASVGIRNANDAISMASTADGALSNITTNLQRMRELAVQKASGTVSNDVDAVAAIDAELTLLSAENKRVVDNSAFNSVKLISAANTTSVELGDGSAAVAFATTAYTATATDATKATVANIDADLKGYNTMRAEYGATQNNFQAIISNLQVNVENLSAARGRIMDADYAMETANLSRAQVLQQAGTAMLAQANQAPQSVLSLLRQ
jgi:flagellin